MYSLPDICTRELTGKIAPVSEPQGEGLAADQVSGVLTEALIGEQPNGVGDLAGKSEVQLTEEFSWIQQIRLRVGIAARVCAMGATDHGRLELWLGGSRQCRPGRTEFGFRTVPSTI